MSVFSFGRDIVYLQAGPQPKHEREAIVILAGLGTKTHNERKIARYFRNKGYDIYQPSYIYRKSMDQGVAKLERFSVKHDLKSYKKVHVFCYIIGGWTFNRWYNRNPLPNISTILYDRSPLQERAPYVLVKDNRLLMKLLVGDIIAELAHTPYSPVKGFNGKIGLLIETKPTKLIRRHRATAASLGPINWSVDHLNQVYDDFCYLPVDHDDMYTAIEQAGPEVLSFIVSGRFGGKANRMAPTVDPLQN